MNMLSLFTPVPNVSRLSNNIIINIVKSGNQIQFTVTFDVSVVPCQSNSNSSVFPFLDILRRFFFKNFFKTAYFEEKHIN